MLRIRHSSPRHYLMCPPTYFEVAYAINPWMDPTRRWIASAPWAVVGAGRGLSSRRPSGGPAHPVQGLPDMVFAANGATLVDGRVLLARFANAARPRRPCTRPGIGVRR